MKVLLVSPFGEHLNGGIAAWTGHIMSYYEHNNDNSVELRLLQNKHSKATFATTSLCRRIYNGISSYLPLYRSFVKETKKEPYDIVHICTSASISLIKDILITKHARKKGIKTIVHCHFGRIPELFAYNNWEKRLFTELLKYTDHLVVMDKKSLDSLIQAGYHNVQYVPNPLAVSVQQIVIEKAGVSRIPNKIIFVGHVVASKGVVELVEACSKLRVRDLYIIGPLPDENLKNRLIDIEKKSQGKWLHFTGALPIERVIEEMQSCAIFALPTYTEGFPNVIIESMACGCPIVTTPVGAIPEMLDIHGEDKCGLCVAPKDAEELMGTIQFLLDNPKEARRLGDRARERVYKEYSMPIVWDKLVDVWIN